MHYSLWTTDLQGDEEALEHNVLAFEGNSRSLPTINNINSRVRVELDTTRNWESKMNRIAHNPAFTMIDYFTVNLTA